MSIKLLNLELFELKFAHERYKTYVLFDGWEVRMVKNCDRGLENAARGRRPRVAFSRPRSQFFTIRISQPANNIYIFDRNIRARILYQKQITRTSPGLSRSQIHFSRTLKFTLTL